MRQLPITVVCVVKHEWEDDSEIQEIQQIKDFCESKAITSYTREYNPHKMPDDRHFVERLPAFHIYVKSGYTHTFYLDTHPKHIIRETVHQFLNKQKENAEKNVIWKIITNALLILRRQKNKRLTSINEWS